MLPLEGMFFIPSLFITPVAVGLILWARRWEDDYPWLWRRAVIACIVLTALYTILSLTRPLYSERDRSPDNPGGPSDSVFVVIGELVLWTCVVIPAFPVLVALACLPPRGWRLLPLVLCGLLYVLVQGWLIAQKNARFVADYEQATINERAERIDAKQQMRQRFRQQQVPR